VATALDRSTREDAPMMSATLAAHEMDRAIALAAEALIAGDDDVDPTSHAP
jgi:hypothetical protein